MGRRLRRMAARTLTALLWVGAGYYFFLGGEYSWMDVRELRAEHGAAAARVESLRSVADSLEARADSLVDRPAVIERTARERYGFIRDGERLYRFVDVPGEGGSSGGSEGGTTVDRPGSSR